jgi:Spy/CpxP family protein refolding chaperone
MKIKLTAATGLMALLLCGAAMPSYAQGPMGPEGFGGGPHGGPMGPMGPMFHDLNLSDAQKQQVKTLMEANKTTLHSLMQQMQQNHLALLQATSGGAYDAAKVQTLANQQAQIQAALTVQHQLLQHQVYTQVLTADQRTKFDEHQADQIKHITEHLQQASSAANPPQ